MSQSNITVTINGSDYPMACAPGEEEKVKALGARIDDVASQIAKASGAIGESRLLVMAALILTDQLNELEAKSSNAPEAETTAASPSVSTAEQDDKDDQLAEMIERLAARVEELAAR